MRLYEISANKNKLKNLQANVGFEFEWIYDTEELLTNYFKQQGIERNIPGNLGYLAKLLGNENIGRYYRYVYSNIAKDISKTLGVKCVVKMPIDVKKYDTTWYIENDETIKIENLEIGVETVTSIYSIKDSYDILAKMLQYISTNGKINQSCGLHLNISIPNIQNMNNLKVILLHDEIYATRMFDKDPKFSKSNIKLVKEKIQIYVDQGFSDTEIISKLEIFFKANNFTNMAIETKGGKYLEWRNVGGTDYIHKYDAIINRLNNYAYLMAIGLTDEKNDLYRKKLLNLIYEARK